MEKDFDRRLRRSWRTISLFRLYRNAARRVSGKISRAHPQRQLLGARPGWDSPRLVAWFLQYSWPLHPRPLPRKTWTQRSADRANVFAFHGRPGSNGVYPQGKSSFHRAGNFIGKNLRTRETGQQIALEGALKLFRAARSKGETQRGDQRRPRAGAAHFSDGKFGRRTTRLSFFPKIRPANQRGEHGREHASAERDRTNLGDAHAVPLRFSQPGSFSPMAAKSLSRVDRGNSGRVTESQTRLVHRHARGRQWRCYHNPQNDCGRSGSRKGIDRRNLSKRAEHL